MIGDLFDSPWKILIVAAVLIVLFGSAKLPVAARSLGKSMRILKTEMKDLHGADDTEPEAATSAPAATQQLPTPLRPTVPQPTAVQQQPTAVQEQAAGRQAQHVETS
jgi:sec-independent protein translocase protein TatA